MTFDRDKAGVQDFHGMNLVRPPDLMPPGKYPFAQNCRRHSQGGISGRAKQDTAVATLGAAVHTLRRLNDSTPNGPGSGYVLVASAAGAVYVNASSVGTGYSGKPLSLIPFRPNASVQPWMYIGDSVKMSKVRSDGALHKMGIAEPQTAPTVQFIPASDVVSLLGDVTVYVFNNPSHAHNAPLQSVYLWHNAGDKGPSTFVETIEMASVVNTGNSLLFDLTSINGTTPVGSANPVKWSQYTIYVGTVSTNGTAVTWDSGDQFNGLVATDKIVISGVTYTVTGTPTNTTLTITASAGIQSAANYTAAKIGDSRDLFAPQLESQGYQDFNCSILGTFYVPAAGTYSFTVSAKDDFIWGIANAPNGTVTWPKPTAGQVYSSYGQTKTTINAYPLIPYAHEASGGDGTYSTVTINITFSAPGNYPFEIDWDYWYHNRRGLMVTCGGLNIPPIPPSAISDSQYRFRYRSSATGAKSNGSPPSRQSPLAVLSNNVGATASPDEQADKIDFFRLDKGLSNYTYVGTIPNILPFTYLLVNAIVATGIQDVPVGPVGAVGVHKPVVGELLQVDSGGNAETVTVLTVFTFVGGGGILWFYFTANFTKTHAINTPMVGSGPLLSDSQLDVDIAGNPILEEDNFEPFPSIDLPRGGLVDVSGGVVSWRSGDKFNIRWLPGTIIIIGSVAYTLNTRPTSDTSLTAANVDLISGIEQVVVPPDGSGFTYEIAEPILAAQPLPYLWGPTDNVQFVFGCGDPLRPGTLYWSKGNDLDSAPDTNQEDVTSPSEPLMNGCIVGGFGLVFSTERRWFIWPNYFNALATVTGTQGDTWTLQEAPSIRGLYITRCLAVEGGGIVLFRAKDGIYAAPGGTGDRSITDDDLWPLFPHEGMVPQPVTIGGYTVYPPDDSQPDKQKLNCATGYLYYDYVDTTGVPRNLVYDIAAAGWTVDVYQYPATVHALEEGPGANGVLVGCSDGSIRPLTDDGLEAGSAIVLMPSFNAGDTRNQKHWGDVYIEIDPGAEDPQLTVTPATQLYKSSVSSGVIQKSTSTTEGRTAIVLDFNSGEGLFSRDLGTVFTWPLQTDNVVRVWQPSMLAMPEGIYSRPGEWDNGGYAGAKFVQGVIVEADSFGASKTFALQSADDGSVHTLLEMPKTFSRQSEIAFSCVPFVAHSVRLVSTDGVAWRVWGSKLVFQPYPEMTMNWTAPMSSLGLTGWGHLRECNIAHISTADLTLRLTFDVWAPITITIPHSSGNMQKVKITIPANKFKLVKPSITSTAPFRLFAPDLELKVKQWGSSDPYAVVKPFGGASNVGAEV